MRGDTGLTDRGRDQARLLEKRLRDEEVRADQLYASTLPRALETAEYVARALDLPVQPDDELHELRPGEADGLTVDEWRERYRPKPPAVRDVFTPFAPGGESWVAFLARAGAAIAALVDRHPGETVVAVCHGGVIEASFYLAFGLGGTARPRLVRGAQHQHHAVAAPPRPRRPPGVDGGDPERRRPPGGRGHPGGVAPRGRPDAARRGGGGRGSVTARSGLHAAAGADRARVPRVEPLAQTG